jgi:hypothetical protein
MSFDPIVTITTPATIPTINPTPSPSRSSSSSPSFAAPTRAPAFSGPSCPREGEGFSEERAGAGVGGSTVSGGFDAAGAMWVACDPLPSHQILMSVPLEAAPIHLSRRDLIRMLAQTRRLLGAHGIRDGECFAEVLVAEATGGCRVQSRTNRGFDVQSPLYKRIEVKSRQMPYGRRVDERVGFDQTKEDGFDYAAIVIFEADFSVKGALLVPYASVWPVASARVDRRISYTQAQALSGAIDITQAVAEAAAR